MSIPEKLMIGAVEFAVEVHEPLVADGKQLYGLWDAANACIGLDAEANREPGRCLQTLLHEVLHEIAHQGNVPLSEANTDRLANGLADFLLRNGLLRKRMHT